MIYIELVDHETEEPIFKYQSASNAIPAVGQFIEYKNQHYYKVMAVTHLVEDVFYKQLHSKTPHCFQIRLNVKKL